MHGGDFSFSFWCSINGDVHITSLIALLHFYIDLLSDMFLTELVQIVKVYVHYFHA